MKRCGKQFAVVLSILFVLFFAVGCRDKSDDISVPEPISGQNVNAVLLHSGNNSITVPDGKSLYVFAAHIPETYNDRNTETHFTVTATDYRTGGSSRSLIPSQTEISSAGSIEDAMKSTRSDVWYFKTDSSNYCRANMDYKWMGKEIVYYSQQGLTDEIDYELLSKILDDYIGDSKEKPNSKCLLGVERTFTQLSGYDVDGTGYFHIMFTDFGESSVGENTGIAGAYELNQIRMCNVADMFYINTRFVVKRYNLYNESESFWKYVTEHYGEIIVEYGSEVNFLYLQVAYNISSVLLHEYCHCLMDCNRYKNGGRMLSGSLFWIEGTANIVPYAMFGDFQDPSAVREWIGKSESYNPSFNSNDNDSNEYATYGAGPLFFGYVLAKYGGDVFKSVLHYNKTNNEDIRTIVRDCTGKSFETVYRDFLLEMLSSCEGMGVKIGNSSGNLNFIKDWGFTLDSVEKASGITRVTQGGAVVYDHKYITKSRKNFSTDLNQLGWVLTKWEGSPSVLNVEGNVLCYALFI
ncbi:MAG: hypothetical protein MJ052_02980 [Sphaerochaetaceae bacterium]|nr:hypothetical protein [Sphaerochaetaceae bacterium]